MRLRAAIAPVVLIVAAFGFSTATAAKAVVPAPVVAHTHLTDRPDSGGNGDWADDYMGRVLTIQQTGGVAGAWTFTATVKDAGHFVTIPAAFTPNQGAPFTGSLIKHVTHGSIMGGAQYSFTASMLPSTAPNAGVPGSENGAPVAADQSTSLWYEQAFPAGTAFTGPGILNTWSWSYNARVRHVSIRYVWVHRHHHWYREQVVVVHVDHQRWVDGALNGGGQLPADGNITG